MPLARDGELNNLCTALETVTPDLRNAVQGFDGTHGMIYGGWQLRVAANPSRKVGSSILSLTLLKLDEGRLMAEPGVDQHDRHRAQRLRPDDAG